MNRVTDLLLVVVITVLPLALLPAIMPYRVCIYLSIQWHCSNAMHASRFYISIQTFQTGEGTWIGGVIERSVKMLFAHLNLQTTVLVNETTLIT